MSIKVLFLAIVGFIFLLLGFVGIFIPVWPTTPFVIVAFGCFSATPRIRSWIMKIPFFRAHIENYQTRRGLPLKTFWQSMIWLWGMIIISLLVVNEMLLYIILPVIGIAVTIHILLMLKPKVKDDHR